MNEIKIVWYCKYCNDVKVSKSLEHHKMDICECGQSGLDLEEYGCRCMGCPIQLAIYDKGKWIRKRK